MFNTFFTFLKPAPHIPPIEDLDRQKSEYKYWRIRILYSAFIGYALYYFSRKSFVFAMPGLIEEYHFDKSQIGSIGSAFALAYGISKFTSGVLSDQSNPRYFMSMGLLVTGLLNILIGFSSSLTFIATFWILNGWFQGFGWPPCARYLTHWYSHSERGTWWSVLMISQNIGAFLIHWIVGICLQYFNWQAGMYIPGLLCIICALFLFNRLRDTPQSLGLPSIEKFRNDYPEHNAASDSQEKECKTKELLFNVLSNKYIWILSLAYFFIYIVRSGFGDWATLMLIETKSYSRLAASGILSFFEIGGLVGMLSAGFISDKVFKGKRGPVNFLFSAAILLSIILFWQLPEGLIWLDCSLIFFIGFTVFGPQMLVGLAAAEYVHKKAAATATGIIGLVAYIGTAAAGYPLGKIIDNLGWEGFIWSMIWCSISLTLLLAPLAYDWRKLPQSEV
jgi:OPA family sugar phosphate sensor protein UhpC-like MFS transporter